MNRKNEKRMSKNDKSKNTNKLKSREENKGKKWGKKEKK